MNSNQYSEKTEKEINDYIQTKYELKLKKNARNIAHYAQ